MGSRGYLVLFGVLSGVYLMALAIIYFVVDPQGIFDTYVREGFNKYKVVSRYSGRYSKGASLYFNQYDVVFLGSSRAESGMDPRMDVLSGKRVFNSALRDPSMTETLGAMDYILKYQKSVSEVYLGLDFFLFSKNRINHPDYEQSVFSGNSHPLWITFKYMLSSGMVRDCFSTVRANRSGAVDRYHVRGHYRSEAEYDVRGAMDYILSYYMTAQTMFGCYEYDVNAMGALASSIDRLMAAGIKVSIFISAQHAKNMLMLERLGLYDEYFAWISDVAKMVDGLEEAGVRGGCSLWDFSGFNAINSERLPEGDGELEFYYETSHYKVNVGERIVETMMTGEIREGFGARLDAGGVEERIEQIVEGGKLYKEKNPLEVRDIELIYQSAQKDRDELSCY